ncbi:ADP-ribosylglycohydrolase family protein [Gloeothece verrucosa]|uniref:ADP-ribosylation/Crystallin J1 n=1 Tax=Gloeothece verrucosa (strain PCC 7822) TaxID=497965 RepID=E0UJM4_GLOV7|nr:ADP-ribosylglycohydrolase family protein [Gloeothece verrucosa]ADN12268.1 ADP-ribosylation/Crystallin J1 [Gloeothece verrucosa PCC 7822]
MSTYLDSIVGCLLGTAVGDALGLPYEGLSRQRQRAIMPNLNAHHLFFGKGMVSDDTEHTCMVAQSLIVSAGNKPVFIKALAWRLRWWLLGLPAGIGFATLRAILKLWLGFSPDSSGVFSAGNGAAMRSAIIGVCYGNNRHQLCDLVKASTRITHSDPKAEYGALAVALAAYLASLKSEIEPHFYYQNLQDLLTPDAQDFLSLIYQACESAKRRETAENFANQLGFFRGVSGYVYQTVPMVMQVWLRHQTDYQNGIREIIQQGGDTDTTAAILGGIIGAAVGPQGIPSPWLQNIWEYPRTIRWIEILGKKLAQVCSENKPQKPLSLSVYFLIIRNGFFTSIIIWHGFRRLLPPY